MKLKEIPFWITIWFYKKIGYSIIHRQGAIGDVFLALPVIRFLKKKTGGKVLLLTANTQFVQNNDIIDKAISSNKKRVLQPLVDLDLNTAYEKCSRVHIIDAYASLAGVEIDDYRSEYEIDISKIRKEIASSPPGIVIDVGYTWPNKMLSTEKLQNIVDAFSSHFPIYSVGIWRKSGNREITNTVSFVNQTNADELAFLIKNAKVVLCPDSFILHLSQAMNTNIVSYFGSTVPQFIVAKNYSRIITIQSLTEQCRGCRHDSPSTYVECKWGTNACVTSIDEDQIIRALNAFLNGGQALLSFGID